MVMNIYQILLKMTYCNNNRISSNLARVARMNPLWLWHNSGEYKVASFYKITGIEECAVIFTMRFGETKCHKRLGCFFSYFPDRLSLLGEW